MLDQDSHHGHSFHPVALWLCRLSALIATVLAAYLGWHVYQSGPIAGCGAESSFSCDEVLNSRWSRWFGLPVGLLAVPVYASIFAASWFLGSKSPESVRRLGWMLIIPLSVAAGFAAVWFTILQIVDVKQICPYCLGTHVCGLVLFGVLFWQLPLHHDEEDSRPMLIAGAAGIITPPQRTGISGLLLALLTSLGALGFAVLLGGQLLYESKTYTFEKHTPTADAAVPSVDGMVVDGTAGDRPDGQPGALDGSLLAAPTSKPNDDEPVFATVRDVTTQGDVVSPPTPSTTAAADAPMDDDRVLDDDLVVETTATFKPVLPVGRQVVYLENKSPLVVEHEMLIGSESAEYVAVELMDYTCKACRRMYFRLREVEKWYGEKLAIAIRPIALEARCNPWIAETDPSHENACRYAIMAMAVWKTDASAFPRFHRWLIVTEPIPPLGQALAFADSIVNPTELRKNLKSQMLKDRLGENNGLVNELGEKLPTLIISDHVLQGITTSHEELRALLDTVIK